MSKKIFVSYKYWDNSVYQDNTLDKISNPNFISCKQITPRSYLNELSNILNDYAIEKWEKDDEDLSNFKDETIRSKLRDKIYDSSITIVLISPNMNDKTQAEQNQWIPWEISYSLKEYTRNNRTSKSNAMIAIVLPDIRNCYDYCIEYNNFCDTNILKFDSCSFNIISKNFFNKKEPKTYKCSKCNYLHFIGTDSHYFAYAKWIDFKNNPSKYIDIALENQLNIDNYRITKTI